MKITTSLLQQNQAKQNLIFCILFIYENIERKKIVGNVAFSYIHIFTISTTKLKPKIRGFLISCCFHPTQDTRHKIWGDSKPHMYLFDGATEDLGSSSLIRTCNKQKYGLHFVVLIIHSLHLFVPYRCLFELFWAFVIGAVFKPGKVRRYLILHFTFQAPRISK